MSNVMVKDKSAIGMLHLTVLLFLSITFSS